MSNTSYRQVLADFLLKSQNETKELGHGRWTSSRLWVVVGFVSIVLFGAYFALQPAQLDIIARVVIVFIVCTTISKIAFAGFNAWMWVTARRAAGDSVDPTERAELDHLKVESGT